eukprot:2285881-Prymnesium_polylepis.1
MCCSASAISFMCVFMCVPSLGAGPPPLPAATVPETYIPRRKRRTAHLAGSGPSALYPLDPRRALTPGTHAASQTTR